LAVKSLKLSGTLTDLTEDNESLPRFAVCINNEGYTVSLEIYKIYRILPDIEAAHHNEIRVIDESGEDYLFPQDWFSPVEIPKALEQRLLAVR